jgi:hypothetical protein
LAAEGLARFDEPTEKSQVKIVRELTRCRCPGIYVVAAAESPCFVEAHLGELVERDFAIIIAVRRVRGSHDVETQLGRRLRVTRRRGVVQEKHGATDGDGRREVLIAVENERERCAALRPERAIEIPRGLAKPPMHPFDFAAACGRGREVDGDSGRVLRT